MRLSRFLTSFSRWSYQLLKLSNTGNSLDNSTRQLTGLQIRVQLSGPLKPRLGLLSSRETVRAEIRKSGQDAKEMSLLSATMTFLETKDNPSKDTGNLRMRWVTLHILPVLKRRYSEPDILRAPMLETPTTPEASASQASFWDWKNSANIFFCRVIRAKISLVLSNIRGELKDVSRPNGSKLQETKKKKKNQSKVCQ